MTALSVNVNKLALLRNSRGRNYPDLLHFVERFIALGVQGITIHPRPDERHIRRQDAYDLAALLKEHPEIEFNIEGYPSDDFLQLIADIKPHQCTLVPDTATQLTSDHGWDCGADKGFLRHTCHVIRKLGVRVALFLDPDADQAGHAAALGAQRIELYTEEYARAFGKPAQAHVLHHYVTAARTAQQLGMGVNAGHDLDLQNLPTFLQIPGILEVSIGHALMVESIELGMNHVIGRYLDICKNSA